MLVAADQKHVYAPVAPANEDRAPRTSMDLPAYSQMDEHSNPDQHHPNQQSYMTAEEEKARLAAFNEYEDNQNNIPVTITRGLPADPVAPQSYPDLHAPASALSRGLQVPTCSRLTSSGFPYPDMLGQYNITEADWARFTTEITTAAKMNGSDWTVAIGGSFATLVVAGVVIGWFGLIPAVIVGHHLRRTRENRNLREAKLTGTLEQTVLKWNQEFFRPRGVLIRLDLPGDAHDINDMDIMTRKRGCHHGNKSAKWEAKMEQKRTKWENKANMKADSCAAKFAAKREKKMEKWEGKLKEKAAKRGRIVILPLNATSKAPESAQVPVYGPYDDAYMNEKIV